MQCVQVDLKVDRRIELNPRVWIETGDDLTLLDAPIDEQRVTELLLDGHLERQRVGRVRHRTLKILGANTHDDA